MTTNDSVSHRAVVENAAPHGTSTRPKLVVSRTALPGNGVDLLRVHSDVRVWEHDEAPTADQLCAFVGDAVGMLGVAKDHIDELLLSRCPTLRSVAIASTGYDYVDVEATRRHNVSVTHTPAVLSGAVADHAFFLITGARRRAHEHISMFRSGTWDHHLALDELLGLDVHGQSLGLIGYGQVGKAIAKRAVGYEMSVMQYSRGTDSRGTDSSGAGDGHAKAVSLNELLATSDIVVMCLPLFPETHHLVAETQLRMMKPSATLVNVGRGATLDEGALVVALQQGWIHSAGLDVFDAEPIQNLDNPLLHLPNAFLTPHMASATQAARSSMISIAAEDLLAMVSGRPPRHLIRELQR
jgi:lactate dehydrogenase-like 2-hydroxyacid dehydrogenase